MMQTDSFSVSTHPKWTHNVEHELHPTSIHMCQGDQAIVHVVFAQISRDKG